MNLTKPFLKPFFIVILSVNCFLYYYTKLIKKNKECLKDKKILINHNSFRVKYLKYSSLLFILVLLVNKIIPINSVLIKIPIVSSFYCFIVLILIIIQIESFMNTLNKINNNNGISCIFKFPFKFKITNLIIKYKYKVSLLYIFLIYIGIIYL